MWTYHFKWDNTMSMSLVAAEPAYFYIHRAKPILEYTLFSFYICFYFKLFRTCSGQDVWYKYQTMSLAKKKTFLVDPIFLKWVYRRVEHTPTFTTTQLAENQSLLGRVIQLLPAILN